LFAHRYAPKSDYSADPGAGPFVIAFGHLGSNAAIRESQIAAIGPVVAQTPDPQATDSGGTATTTDCQTTLGPSGSKITWTFLIRSA
jgi:hypothetical protein